MEEKSQYVDLSGVRETSSSPEYSSCRDDAVRTSAEGTHTVMQLLPQRSTSGGPHYSASSNGNNGHSSARPSAVRARRVNATTASSVVASTPDAVPLRRRDSIKHPYALSPVQPVHVVPNGSRVDPASPPPGNDFHQQPHHYKGDHLYRASVHGRRRSASVAVLNRDASNSSDPVNTTVSASPDRPDMAAAPVATTQEDVKRYVHTVMANHDATLGRWEQRVTVAEVYRDKPLRTGGRPALLRAQDRCFLERVSWGLQAQLLQLADARSLLLQTRKEVPLTKAGRHGDLNAWDEYCSCYEQTLMDLRSEAEQLCKRVHWLLKGDQPEGTRVHQIRSGSLPQSGCVRPSRARSQGSVASRRSSPRTTPRGQTPAPVEGGRASAHTSNGARTADASTSSHRHHSNGVAAATAGGHHSPYVHLGRGAVKRGSQVIRPGHKTQSAVRASPAPDNQRSSTVASSTHNSLRSSVGRAQSLTTWRSQQQTRALHPDTVVRQSVPTCSPNDLQSPYGHIISPKRSSSALRDPAHAVLVVPPPADVVAEISEEVDVSATAHSSRASHVSRGSYASHAVSPKSAVNDTPPQLRTYASPRGLTRSATPSSATSPLRSLDRNKLLETIQRYERDSTALQRSDLHHARECFYALYGEQQGLNQYCLWIDNIALSALAIPGDSA
ncbi:hypothetical protein ABL78_0510 [Leptomonas seymouri]|uniref:Uncharacterized protein n=1 Tax=Leptomonas seymouri TaxID=5684 RepID=A0A0N1I8T3_LEPSE|nr:hypothetical protein ABL78_0510 [Leptomonas seymouri]|eukprot:KPI90434.1 hypothetical protein ABL78_0510 [Leptomonas seymouri]